MSSSAYPELVHGRRDGFAQGPWRVEEGEARRGGASCNLSERQLRVPSGTDEVSRVVRAHELMHIRISPHRSEHLPDEDLPARALECAEEYRVNLLLARTGFDVGSLRDGSERSGAQRLAAGDQWSEAVCFFLAVLGTGGEADFLRGLRATPPSWPAALRSLKKAVASLVLAAGYEVAGDTNLTEAGVPRGYLEVTVPIARLVARSMSAAAPLDQESLRTFRRSLEPGARRAPSGVFADLRWDESMTYVAAPRRRAHRRPRPSTTGTVMRYPSRLLTDHLCRAFSRKTAVPGGVVVIDQSGSMDVTCDDLDKLLAGAPDALIVGYSHRPGDHGGVANAWVLAARGRVAAQARPGNIGNGVDGPVLRWAVGQARGNEPIVWVTDGQVTDSHDHPCHSLSLECARLVHRRRIRMVRELEEVEPALRGQWLKGGSFGRVGKELLVMKGF